jgi:hypothetical protein
MEDRYSFKQAGEYFRKLFTCYFVLLLVLLVGWLPYTNVISAVATPILLLIIFIILQKLIGFSPETIWRQSSGKARTTALLSFMVSSSAYGFAYFTMPGMISNVWTGHRPEHFHLFVTLVLLAVILSFYQMFVITRMCVFVAERLTSKKITARTRHVHISFAVLLTITLLFGVGAIFLDAVNSTAEVNTEISSTPIHGVVKFLLIAYAGFLIHCYVAFLYMLKMTASKMSTAIRNQSRSPSEKVEE